jgi:hypothetical protein
MKDLRTWHIGGLLAIVVIGLLSLSRVEAADARSDLDSYKREFENLRRDFDSRKIEADRYMENSRAVRALDKGELEKLIIAMCGNDAARDNDEASRLNLSLREKAIASVNTKWNDVEREFDVVDDKTERLMNDTKSLRDKVRNLADEASIHSERADLIDKVGRMVDDVDRLYAKIQEDFRAASNVKNGDLLGSNNPKIRSALEYGKAKHIEMQSSYSCDEKEVTLSSGRPDCVNFKPKDDCQVIEFKPSTVGESAAQTQASRYLSDVRDKFKSDSRADNCKKDSDGYPIFVAVGKTYTACTP